MSVAVPIIRLIVEAAVDYGLDWLSNPFYHGAEGVKQVEFTGAYELQKLVLVWTQAPAAAPAQDVRLTTHHFLKLVDGEPSADWTDANHVTVEDAVQAFWTAQKGGWSHSTALIEGRWFADGPAFKPHGDASSPLLRVHPFTGAGTSGSPQLPPQIALSVTEITDARYHTVAREGRPAQLRHRWGRFYLPAPSTVFMGAEDASREGRVASVQQVSVADAVTTLYNACRAAHLVPVMYSPTTGNTWSVDAIHVDDIWDVVRSRRYETPLSREARSLAALT